MHIDRLKRFTHTRMDIIADSMTLILRPGAACFRSNPPRSLKSLHTTLAEKP